MKENLNDYIAEKIHNENRRRIQALLKECVYLEQVQRAFADFPQGEIQEMFNDLQNEYLEKMRANRIQNAREEGCRNGCMAERVTMYQEFRFSRTDAITDFVKRFSVSEQEAEKFINENWNKEDTHE